MALSVQLQNGTLGYTNTISTDAGGNTTDVLSPQTLRALFSDGVLANQANRAYRDYQILSSPKTYTLSALPGSQAIVKARLLYVQVLTANTAAGATLAITPGATHGWAGGLGGETLVAGSVLLITWPALAGAPVASGTTDQVTFTPSGGAVEYVACFVGTNA